MVSKAKGVELVAPNQRCMPHLPPQNMGSGTNRERGVLMGVNNNKDKRLKAKGARDLLALNF